MVGLPMSFSRRSFEARVRGIFAAHRWNNWELDDVTETLACKYPIKEHVYLAPSGHPPVHVLIFSSIDTSDGMSRPKDSDAVRLVMRWRTRDGFIYRRMKTHYRTEGMFVRLENTLLKHRLHGRVPHFKGWKPEAEFFGDFLGTRRTVENLVGDPGA